MQFFVRLLRKCIMITNISNSCRCYVCKAYQVPKGYGSLPQLNVLMYPFVFCLNINKGYVYSFDERRWEQTTINHFQHIPELYTGVKSPGEFLQRTSQKLRIVA